jgi:hypothetical protein
MPTVLESIQRLFQAHQARLASIAAASGASPLSGSLRETSATCLSKQIQALVKQQYAADCSAGATPEDKITKLAASLANLAKQIKPLAPNDAFYEAFTSGSLAAAHEVFLSIFGLSLSS